MLAETRFLLILLKTLMIVLIEFGSPFGICFNIKGEIIKQIIKLCEHIFQKIACPTD